MIKALLSLLLFTGAACGAAEVDQKLSRVIATYDIQPCHNGLKGDFADFGEKLFDAETGEPIMENDGDAYLVTGSADHAFDTIGLIHKATGVMLTDAEGIEYPEMAPVPGWHVNLRIRGDYMRDEAEAIDAADGVSPVTPHRTWL